jgi:hypothetical protein
MGEFLENYACDMVARNYFVLTSLCPVNTPIFKEARLEG